MTKNRLSRLTFRKRSMERLEARHALAGEIFQGTEDDPFISGLVTENSITVESLPAGATFNPDGTFRVVPRVEDQSLDEGEYRDLLLRYRSGSDPTLLQVTVRINGRNDAPIPDADATALGTEDAAIEGRVPVALDIDNEPLTYRLVGSPPTGVTFNPDGTYRVVPTTADQQLDTGENRAVVFEFVAFDGTVESLPAVVTVTINGVNDAPTAGNDFLNVPKNGALQFSTNQVTANDSDLDDAIAGITILSNPAQGRLVNQYNGSYSYIPREGFSGNDTISYVASDGEANSVAATITFRVASPSVPLGKAPGDFLLGMTSTGEWFGSHLVTGVSQTLARWNPAVGWQNPLTGDFNGDGATDITARTAGGGWWVGLAGTNSFTTTPWGVWGESTTFDKLVVADVNADGRDDLVGFQQRGPATYWRLGVSTGTGFVDHFIYWQHGITWVDLQINDMNGDGFADFVGRIGDNIAGSGGWWLNSTSNATGSLQVTPPRFLGYWSPIEWRNVMSLDYNGDGKSDFVGRTNHGAWWLAESNGTTIVNRFLTNWYEAAGWLNLRTGDLDGNGRDEIFGQDLTGKWWRSFANGSTTITEGLSRGTESATISFSSVFVGDLDQDGVDEILARQTSDGIWRLEHLVGTQLVRRNSAAQRPQWSISTSWFGASLGYDDGGLFS